MNGRFRNVLITGATSPIGHALAELVRRDNPGARIAGLSRRAVGPPFDRSCQIDLRAPIPAIDGEYDLVIHAAAAVPASVKTPGEFHAVNVDGSVLLFDALRLSPDAAILNISSSSVYDAPDVAELDEAAPKTTGGYGASKLAFEQWLEHALGPTGATVLSVRIPVLLVPGVANNFVSRWVTSIRAGEAITLFNPDGLLNAVVDDESLYAFARTYLGRREGGALSCNLAAREPMQIRSAGRLMMDALGRAVEVIERPAPKPTQTINCALAERNGYVAPTTAECLTRFARRSLTQELT